MGLGLGGTGKLLDIYFYSSKTPFEGNLGQLNQRSPQGVASLDSENKELFCVLNSPLQKLAISPFSLEKIKSILSLTEYRWRKVSTILPL